MRTAPYPTAALVALALFGPSAKTYADVMQVFSPTGLSSNDIHLGIASSAQPVGYVSPGDSISFVTGDRLTFTRVRNQGQFEVDQAGLNYGGTAFANGTYLVGAGGFQGPGDGLSVILTFTNPVVQFGLNIEDFNGGPYAVNFTAYDASGVALTSANDPTGVFIAAGDDPINGDPGLLSFEGLTSTSDPIARVEFTDGPTGSNDLVFGNIAFAPVGTALQAPPAVTPEPSSLALLGTGLLGAFFLGRRGMHTVRSVAAKN